jgi:lysine-specific demethylase/histidyl-hydroxylase NO66
VQSLQDDGAALGEQPEDRVRGHLVGHLGARAAGGREAARVDDGAVPGDAQERGPQPPPGQQLVDGGAGAEVADQVSSDSVLRLFAEGSTIVLQGLHRLWPPLIEFADQLAADLGHPTQVNAYVTPPSARGFSAHYDVHDVFVLQVAGEKHWRIHAPVHPDPLRSQPWTDRRAEVAAAAEGEPLIDTVLCPGDVLYLPRGYLHSATALGGISAHLTVGVHSVTRWSAAEAVLDVVRELAAGDPQLRRSLPLGLDLGADLAGPSAATDDVAAVLAGLRDWLDRVDPAEVVDRLRERTWAQVRPEPVLPLATATAAAALTPDTVLGLRRRLRCRLHEPADGRVVLVGGRPGRTARDGRAEGRRPPRPRCRRPALARAAAGHRVDRRGARRGAAPGARCRARWGP